MIQIDLPTLVKRLNLFSRQALEMAASECMSQQAAEITVSHVLIQMLAMPRSDLRVITRQGDIGMEELRQALTVENYTTARSADSYPAFSPMLVEWLKEGWLLASAEMQHSELRGGVLLLALLHSPLRYIPPAAARLLTGINRDRLQQDFVQWTQESAESVVPDADGKVAGTLTWFGWDGDRLTTVQTDTTRIQTVYQPGSFTPLLRIETENGEQAKARHRSLAEVLQEDTGVTLPAELAVMLGRLERELRQGSVSEESQQWLAQCGLTAEQMAAQLEAEYIPERKLHLYHCDHRGLPQALISPEGETAWRGEYDEWGNLLGEESTQHLQQSLRLPGQQYDEESGLYYNRHRYYDPLQGRYITQDPIGLKGGMNLYQYPSDPVGYVDPLGLSGLSGFSSGFSNYMQSARSLGMSMAEQGASPEDISASLEHLAEGDLPKQARQYVEGLVYGSATLASIFVCPTAPYAVSGSLTGGANALNQIVNGGDFSFSDVYVATNAGILTEGRSLVATIGINVAGYSASNLLKGTTQTNEGVASTVIGTIAGFGTMKGLGSSNAATGVGAVVTEVTTSKTNEKLSE